MNEWVDWMKDSMDGMDGEYGWMDMGWIWYGYGMEMGWAHTKPVSGIQWPRTPPHSIVAISLIHMSNLHQK